MKKHENVKKIEYQEFLIICYEEIGKKTAFMFWKVVNSVNIFRLYF